MTTEYLESANRQGDLRLRMRRQDGRWHSEVLCGPQTTPRLVLTAGVSEVASGCPMPSVPLVIQEVTECEVSGARSALVGTGLAHGLYSSLSACFRGDDEVEWDWACHVRSWESLRGSLECAVAEEEADSDAVNLLPVRLCHARGLSLVASNAATWTDPQGTTWHGSVEPALPLTDVGWTITEHGLALRISWRQVLHQQQRGGLSSSHLRWKWRLKRSRNVAEVEPT